MRPNEKSSREHPCVGHYPDSKPLTNAHRRKLCELMFYAFCDIRFTASHPPDRALQQIAGLSDAFHNLPNLIWEDEFSLAEFRRNVERCFAHDKVSTRIAIDYLAEIDKIIATRD